MQKFVHRNDWDMTQIHRSMTRSKAQLQTTASAVLLANYAAALGSDLSVESSISNFEVWVIWVLHSARCGPTALLPLLFGQRYCCLDLKPVDGKDIFFLRSAFEHEICRWFWLKLVEIQTDQKRAWLVKKNNLRVIIMVFYVLDLQ